MLVVEIALLVTWQILTPMTAQYQELPGFKFTHSCQVTDRNVSEKIELVIFGWHGGLLAWGAYLATGIRNITANFNESKLIAGAMYTTFIIMIIIVPAVYMMGVNAPGGVYVLKNIGVFLLLTSSICIIFVPKIKHLVVGSWRDLENTVNTNTNTKTGTTTSVDVAEYEEKISMLTQEIAMLKKENQSLKTEIEQLKGASAKVAPA